MVRSGAVSRVGRAVSKDAAQVRRENKLALIIGFSVLLVVAVLVSDHLSQARRDDVGDGMALLPALPDEALLFNTPLSDAGRANGNDGVRVDATPDPEPPRARAVETRLADQAVPSRDEPAPAGPAPLVIGNGPAAERLASSEDNGARSRGLFDWDTSRIQALLERARSQDEPASQASNTPAGQPPAQTGREGFVESAGVYVVQPGDSLYKIAERFHGDGNKWRDLAALNKGRVGDDGTVYVGVTLKLLPGAKARPAGHATPASREPARAEKPKVETRSYTVKRGDTLSQIAQREAGSVRFLDQIRALNPWLRENDDSIQVGQTLVLPKPQEGR
jgi:nucleoid-associated protein YgaU